MIIHIFTRGSLLEKERERCEIMRPSDLTRYCSTESPNMPCRALFFGNFTQRSDCSLFKHYEVCFVIDMIIIIMVIITDIIIAGSLIRIRESQNENAFLDLVSA